MKTARVKFDVQDGFETGDCVECPLNVIDWSNAEDGFPSHCQLDFDWDKCPIELKGTGDSSVDKGDAMTMERLYLKQRQMNGIGLIGMNISKITSLTGGICRRLRNEGL